MKFIRIGLALLLAVALIGIGPSICHAALNAKALLDLPVGSASNAGEYTTSLSRTEVVPSGPSFYSYNARISVGSGSTDSVISAYANINTHVGDNQIAVQSIGIYRDTIYVAGGASPSQVFLQLDVDAEFSVPELYQTPVFGTLVYGYGQAGIVFSAGEAGPNDPVFNPLGYGFPQYATDAFIHVSDDNSQSGLQRQTRSPS